MEEHILRGTEVIVDEGSMNEVLSDMNTDSLLDTEWLTMEEMIRLLELFAKVTDILQTDALSLSNIIPSLVDLQVHLEQFTNTSLSPRTCSVISNNDLIPF